MHLSSQAVGEFFFFSQNEKTRVKGNKSYVRTLKRAQRERGHDNNGRILTRATFAGQNVFVLTDGTVSAGDVRHAVALAGLLVALVAHYPELVALTRLAFASFFPGVTEPAVLAPETNVVITHASGRTSPETRRRHSLVTHGPFVSLFAATHQFAVKVDFARLSVILGDRRTGARFAAAGERIAVKTFRAYLAVGATGVMRAVL